jgi:predicted amidophosphoribosyltransferase
LVPAPLHAARRRERGFDQAEWLARAVAARLGLDVACGVLARRRATLPQGDPRVTSRSANVEGAFAVVRLRAVAGRSVVLVDDVLTSGATARACAEQLLAAGARDVSVLTACRS